MIKKLNKVFAYRIDAGEFEGMYFDPIHAVFIDFGEKKGEIIISTGGACFSIYWGAIPNKWEAKEFFLKCDIEYLIECFGAPSVYHEKVVARLQKALKEEL